MVVGTGPPSGVVSEYTWNPAAHLRVQLQQDCRAGRDRGRVGGKNPLDRIRRGSESHWGQYAQSGCNERQGRACTPGQPSLDRFWIGSGFHRWLPQWISQFAVEKLCWIGPAMNRKYGWAVRRAPAGSHKFLIGLRALAAWRMFLARRVSAVLGPPATLEDARKRGGPSALQRPRWMKLLARPLRG